MRLYLDASVLAAALLQEPGSDAVTEALESSGADLLVSDFAAAEVASALSRQVRMGVDTEVQAARRLEQFDEWRAITTTAVTLTAVDMEQADRIVRRFDLQLRTPDAVHVAMSGRLDARLVTLHLRLARAAAALGLPTAPPFD
ncbi:MAG: type II toxin-antitoxin system VapC family toxin [Brevundimonas sp.]|uniref:type II toxin-antitoxin system VapC family toxin n=1 Tax=Brevundimonas sp. TaxID=1871086 RepID=UPI00391B2381